MKKGDYSVESDILRTTSTKFTAKQRRALHIIYQPWVKYLMLIGGSRSGKTFLFLWFFVYIATVVKGARMCMLRLHRIDIKGAVWDDTLKKVLSEFKLVAGIDYVKNEQDLVIKFKGGSEIWFGGLDDASRVDKILGKEYVYMFFNECSQLSYDAITTAITRLAQKVGGLVPKGFFDMNPGRKRSWNYRWFILKLDPATGEKYDAPKELHWLKINPEDNRENLPDGYIEGTLSRLPESKKLRFLYGEFSDEEGTVFYSLTDEMFVAPEEMPTEYDGYSIGVDFGLHCAAVLIGRRGPSVYVMDEIVRYNITASELDDEIVKKGWRSLGRKRVVSYCDPSGGERLKSIKNAALAKNDIEAGIDYMVDIMNSKDLFVCTKCQMLTDALFEYKRDEDGDVVKDLFDHPVDALRYGSYSYTKPTVFVETKRMKEAKPITSGLRGRRF